MQATSPEVEFLLATIKAIVEFPHDVKVTRKVDEMGVLLTLDVNQSDMGKVIGRAGATAQAIRSLVRVVGMKNNARVNLLITDPRRAATISRAETVDDLDLKGI